MTHSKRSRIPSYRHHKPSGQAVVTLNGHDRYRGSVMDRLAAAAERVADATEAKLVIFGHTHRECEGPRYVNTGSFAHPRPPAEPGRPYLEIESDGEALRARRRRITST